MLSAAIVDLDGTVYRGADLLPGADRALSALREAGVDVLFFSNNPTLSPEAYVDRLGEMGVDAAPDEVLTSAVVTARFLADEHAGDDLFVIGSDGLRDQLQAAALSLNDDPVAADVLVASYDRGFDYDDLTAGLRALRDDDTAFVGTDPDKVIPTAGGELVPGSGAIVGAIAVTADRDPDHVLGKPSGHAVAMALDRLGADAADCVVVGDRPDTDIAMGRKAGAATVLVRTGVSAGDDVGDHVPDHVTASLADVPALLLPDSHR